MLLCVTGSLNHVTVCARQPVPCYCVRQAAFAMLLCVTACAMLLCVTDSLYHVTVCAR